MAPTKLRIALDWTANTLHSGLFLARDKGFYKNHDLEVELLPPDAEYTRTPAKQLEAGEVDLAICPSESCIAYNESGKMRLQAIYAILQKDASAIVSTKVERLGDVRRYGSYGAKYEDAIVQAMVRKDGGDVEKLEIEGDVGKLSMFDAVKAGRIDATWVFLPWEGVEAEFEGVELKEVRLEDYGIPYGYSPVIARNANQSPSDEVLKAFVAATREGYENALKSPHDAAAILEKLTDPPRSNEFLQKSQARLDRYVSDGRNELGFMQMEKWREWLGWLREQGLLSGPEEIREDDVFTNEFV